MTAAGWVENAAAIVGTGVVVQILNYLRNSRKDSTAATLNFNAQLIAEQRDWRQTLRREVDHLTETLRALQTENTTLLRKVAMLEAHNEDLQRDNASLENRVMELERDLKKHDAAAAVRSAGVVGLI